MQDVLVLRYFFNFQFRLKVVLVNKLKITEIPWEIANTPNRVNFLIVIKWKCVIRIKTTFVIWVLGPCVLVIIINVKIA